MFRYDAPFSSYKGTFLTPSSPQADALEVGIINMFRPNCPQYIHAPKNCPLFIARYTPFSIIID